MLAPGGEIEQHSQWSDLALESLGLYPEFVRELEEASGRRIDFQQKGAVEAAFDGAELSALERRAAAQQALGIASETIRAGDVPGLAPSIAGARFFPGDALVDPRDVMTALRKALPALGVGLREGTRVHRIAAGANEVRVECAGEVVHGGRVVLAAGAWSSGIAVTLPDDAPPLPESFPMRGHLIGYALPSTSPGPILRHGHTYVLQRAGGLTIAGTTSEEAGFDRSIDPSAVVDIRARAGRLAPGLAAIDPASVWTGFRPGIRADGPALGRVGGSALWLAYGHYRNGILLAPATAARISREM